MGRQAAAPRSITKSCAQGCKHARLQTSVCRGGCGLGARREYEAGKDARDAETALHGIDMSCLLEGIKEDVHVVHTDACETAHNVMQGRGPKCYKCCNSRFESADLITRQSGFDPTGCESLSTWYLQPRASAQDDIDAQHVE